MTGLLRPLFLGLALLAAYTAQGGLASRAAAATEGSRGLVVTLKQSEQANAPTGESVKLYGASYALVIGIDNYTGGWPRLSNAIKDARLVGEALQARGFEVQLALDLDADQLEDAFEAFFIEKGADPEARLFVWYAGHGHTQNQEGFLVPADAPLPSEGTTFRRKALSMRRFGEYVRLAESKHAFSVFDSCFAGTIFEGARSAPPPAITRATILPVRAFLSSGDADQQVSDDGTFRQLFIEALEGKRRSDANNDGYLTSSELGLFLTDSISNYTQNQQTPRFGKLRDPRFDNGDFVFQLASLGDAATALAPPPSGTAGQNDRSLDLAFWNAVKDSDDPAAYQAYLDQFPNGTFISLAQLKIDKLNRGLSGQPAQSGSQVQTLTQNQTQTQTAALPPTPEAQSSYKIKALLDQRFMLKAARVMSAPNASSAKIGQLPAGREVTVTGEVLGGNWMRVALESGREGFIERDRVSGPFKAPENPQPQQQPAASAESGDDGGGLFGFIGGITQGITGLAGSSQNVVVAANGQYDGHWKGHANMSNGRCKARFFLDFRIAGGRADGRMVLTEGDEVGLAGTVDVNGRVDMAASKWSVTRFDGRVVGNSVKGVWETPRISATNPGCSGTFTIARVGS